MCFSTTASFTAGALLTTIGVASIKKTQSPAQWMFACIPLVFAIQQFSEGFVWVALLHPGHYLFQQASIYIFLAFALSVWPAWVPLAMLFIEKNHNRRIILGIFSGLGLLFSILSIYYLIVYHSAARITSYHIYYDLDITIPYDSRVFLGILYLLPTVISPFISSVKGTPLMGFCVLLSYFVTKLFFNDYVISVWCFFAAIISASIYFILTRKSLKSKVFELI